MPSQSLDSLVHISFLSIRSFELLALFKLSRIISVMFPESFSNSNIKIHPCRIHSSYIHTQNDSARNFFAKRHMRPMRHMSFCLGLPAASASPSLRRLSKIWRNGFKFAIASAEKDQKKMNLHSSSDDKTTGRSAGNPGLPWISLKSHLDYP